LHTVKATANHIHEHGGEFALPVKENRRTLFDALDTLPWGQVPIAHTATDKGHGRITTRTIQVLPAPEDLPFPHVNQVFLIERYVTDLEGQPILAVAALGVASPEPAQANAADLAGYVREQWSIQSLHWLRSATARSGLSAWPDASKSPKLPDGPDAPWTAHSPSSDSHHDLGTVVAYGRSRCRSSGSVSASLPCPRTHRQDRRYFCRKKNMLGPKHIRAKRACMVRSATSMRRAGVAFLMSG